MRRKRDCQVDLSSKTSEQFVYLNYPDKGNMLKTTNIERQREYDRRMEWEEERWKMEREREYMEDSWRDSWGEKLVEEKFECFDNRW